MFVLPLANQRAGKPREPRAFPLEHFRESWRKQKAEFALAAKGDRVHRREFPVAITRMTHDEMVAPRSAKITGEIGGIILCGIERRISSKSLVGGEAARRRLPCETTREPGNRERLRHFDTAPHDSRGTIGACPQPDLAGKPLSFEARKQRRADLRQDVDMLVPIDEIWSRAEVIAKAIKLARNFIADLGFRKRLLAGGLDQLADFRQASGRGEAWHVSKRRAQRKIEVKADVGLGLEGEERTGAFRPSGAVCHDTHGAQTASAKSFKNPAADTGRQREIIGAEAE